jgi:hypothetical protein
VAERYRFVVTSGHEDAIEPVVQRHASYLVVEKVGEMSREQLTATTHKSGTVESSRRPIAPVQPYLMRQQER